MVQRNETVLVVDFGAQYAQLIARRVRELNVYSEIVPHRISAAELAADPPAALILSGGPKSVHVDGAPSLDPAIYELGIPIFGICNSAARSVGACAANMAEPSWRSPTARRDCFTTSRRRTMCG
jgi:GMP synthase (glutamine-hydrolysing)